MPVSRPNVVHAESTLQRDFHLDDDDARSLRERWTRKSAPNARRQWLWASSLCAQMVNLTGLTVHFVGTRKVDMGLMALQSNGNLGLFHLIHNFPSYFSLIFSTISLHKTLIWILRLGFQSPHCLLLCLTRIRQKISRI